MNRKSRFGLKNKKTQMAVSLMHKFVLVLAFFVMIATTAHAGAFLKHDVGIENDQEVHTPGVISSSISAGGITYYVENRSRNDIDSWADDSDYDPAMVLDTSLYQNGFGYLKQDEYTGFYLGTFTPQDGSNGNNNDSEDDLLNLIRYFLDDTSIEMLGYAKHDLDETDPNKEFTTDSDYYSLKVTVQSQDDLSDTKSGTWTVNNNSSDDDINKINFYSVKGANEYALYYVDPAESSGSWTTAHLLTPNGNSVPALSHLSVGKVYETTSTNATPEPATMLLFGFSLMGLAGMARRRNSKF